MYHTQKTKHMSSVVAATAVSVVLLYIGTTSTAHAAIWDSVGCDGVDCTSCHLIGLANSFIQWFIAFLFLLFILVSVRAGFGLLSAVLGNASGITLARERLTNAIIGLLIVVAGWVIINTLVTGLVGDDGEVNGVLWSQVECQVLTPGGAVDLSFDVITDEAVIPGAPSLDSLAGVTPGSVGEGATVNGDLVDYQGRLFDSGVVGRVQELHQNFPGLRLTGGHRTPERNAQVNGSPTSYHLAGRAADFVGSAADMQAAADWARANGAREVLVHNAGSGTHLHVAW